MKSAALLRTIVLALFCSSLVACQSGTRAQNRDLARRVYEDGLNRGVFDVPYTRDFVGHSGATTFTHEDGMAEAKGWRAAFPDLEMKIDRMVAERDFVTVRWTARGTNTGNGNGIAATGNSVTIGGMTMFRFENGAIAEEWTSGDSLSLMRQLGLLPASAGRMTRGQ